MIELMGDDGGRVEVDVSAVVDSSFAAEGGLALQVTLPQGYSSDLSFWDASTGGNQLTPQGADNVLENWSTPTGGVYSGTIWVEDDALAQPENGSSYVILAQVVPVVGKRRRQCRRRHPHRRRRIGRRPDVAVRQ